MSYIRNWTKTFLVLLLKINPRGNYSMWKKVLAKTDPSKVVVVSDSLKNHKILRKINLADFWSKSVLILWTITENKIKYKKYSIYLLRKPLNFVRKTKRKSSYWTIFHFSPFSILNYAVKKWQKRASGTPMDSQRSIWSRGMIAIRKLFC